MSCLVDIIGLIRKRRERGEELGDWGLVEILFDFRSLIAITIVVHRPYCRPDWARETFARTSGSESFRELLELLNARTSCRTCCNEKVVRLEWNG